MTSNRERIAQYLADHPGAGIRAAARDLGVNPGTVSRVRATPATPLQPSATPESATPATPDLATAVAAVLCAAESGELARDDVARIVASRWDLKPGDRLEFDSGQLFREQARPRRSVSQRAQ
jgi:hypothetical protein